MALASAPRNLLLTIYLLISVTSEWCYYIRNPSRNPPLVSSELSWSNCLWKHLHRYTWMRDLLASSCLSIRLVNNQGECQTSIWLSFAIKGIWGKIYKCSVAHFFLKFILWWKVRICCYLFLQKNSQLINYYCYSF